MNRSPLLINAWLLVVALAFGSGCKHEPIVAPVEDTGNGGGGGEEENPCDPNIIWFQQQVLPILTSSCTNPGEGLNCHHTANDENDEIQITSYEMLMGSDIVQDGDFWEVLNETDPDDVMPRYPVPALTPDQLKIIAQWLQQGAQNTSCENVGCDTLNVTYSGTIAPILDARCRSCHNANSNSGGIDLTLWSVVNGLAMDGRLEGSIRHLGDPYIAMPPSGPQLSDCRIEQFLIWIEQGAPNN